MLIEIFSSKNDKFLKNLFLSIILTNILSYYSAHCSCWLENDLSSQIMVGSGAYGCSQCYYYNDQNCIDCCCYHDQFCHLCSNSNSVLCIECLTGTGVTSNGLCSTCHDLHCFSCSRNETICTQCNDPYGVTPQSTCQKCLQPNCISCQFNFNNSCIACQPGYGASLDQKQCIKCFDINCYNCSKFYIVCVQCMELYGLNDSNTSDSVCHPCPSPCYHCSGNNMTNCTSCIESYYFQSNSCLLCQPGCQFCRNQTYCTQCYQFGYYLAPNFSCCACSQYCNRCFYNSQKQSESCQECLYPYFILNNNQPKHCQQFCGDSQIFTLPCDLGPTYFRYSGCFANCSIQSDFICDTIDNKSICSYTQPVQMFIISCIRDPIYNFFTVSLQVKPPLNLFSTSDLKDVFEIQNSGMDISSITFDAALGTITFVIDFFSDFLNQNFTILFIPNALQFQHSVNSSVTLEIEYYYYSQYIIKTSSAIHTLCFIIIILSGLCLIVGPFLRKLAGLQTMITVQFAFVTIIWFNQTLLTSLYSISPLKYSSGLSLNIFQDVPLNQNITNPIFYQEINPKFTVSSHRYPHLFPFKFMSSHFTNNFFINFFLQLIPFLITLLCTLIICFLKFKKSAVTSSKLTDQQKQIKKLQNIKCISFSTLLYFSLYNIIYFINCSFWYFTFDKIVMTSPHLIVFVVVSFIYVYLFALFVFKQWNFSYFRFSFKTKCLSSSFYLFYPIAIFVTAFLLCMIPEMPWAPIIPVSVLLLYMIINQPYRGWYENVRSGFNIILIIAFLNVRVFIQYAKQNTLNSSKTHSFILTLIILLLLTILITIAFFIYQIYYLYTLPHKKKSDQSKTLDQLQMLIFQQKIKKIKKQENASKPSNQPQFNLLSFSQKLDEIYQGKFQSRDDYETPDRNITRQLQLTVQTQPILELENHQKNKITKHPLQNQQLTLQKIKSEHLKLQKRLPPPRDYLYDQPLSQTRKKQQTSFKKVKHFMIEQNKLIRMSNLNRVEDRENNDDGRNIDINNNT